MKKIISTTALSTLLLCGGFATSVVMAQSASIQPTGEWKVSPLGQGAQSYCALSRSYEEGLVLTMGQNLGKEYSLAIDFQDASLNTSQSYKVALQPGPGQVRAYQLRAASQRALVIRVGDDASFIDALEKSQNLKAQINGQDYNFALNDFAQGQAKLKSCMNGLGSTPVEMASNVAVPKAEKMDADEVAMKKAAAEKLASERAAQQKAAEAAAKKAIEEQKQEQRQRQKELSAVKEPVKTVEAPTRLVAEDAIETPEPIIVQRAVAAPAPKIEKVIVEAPKVIKEEAPQKAVKVASVTKEAPVVANATPSMRVSKYEAIKDNEVASQSLNTRSNLVSKRSPVSKEGGVIRPSILSERPAIPNDTKNEAKSDTNNELKKETKIVRRIPKPEVVASKVIEAPAEKIQPKIVIEEAIEAPEPIIVRKVEAVKPVIPKPELLETKVIEAPKVIASRVVPQAVPKADLKVEPRVEPKVVERIKVPEKPVELASANRGVSKRQSALSSLSDQRPRAWNNTLEKKQQEELDRIKAENKRLNEALQAQIKKPVASVAPPKQVLKAPDVSDQEVAKLKAQVAKLESELAQKPKVDAFVSPEMKAEIEMLRAENKKLVGSLKSQETKIDRFDAQSPTASAELQKMREEVALLKTQNERLSKEAMKANNQIDGVRIDAGNSALSKVREYEKRLAAAKEDNLMLSRKIEAMKNRKDEVALAAASGDWNLEKATRRYNEAEREINRLGMLLEQQRTAHRDEKVQLEQMLFDPAVTDKQQRRRLVELEAKLVAAERQLEAMGRARPQDRYDGSLARLEAPQVTPKQVTPKQVAPRQVAPVAQRPQPIIKMDPVPVTRMPEPTKKVRYQTPFPNSGASITSAPLTQVASQRLEPKIRPPVVQDKKVPMVAPAKASSSSIEINPPFRNTRTIQPAVQQKAPARPSINNRDLEKILRDAGVKSTNVRQGANGQYQWSTGVVSGVAQLQPRKQYRDINQFAQQYISKAKGACKGDFASSATGAPSNKRQSYDLVCIGGTQDVASSVVFAERGDSIMAITHMANTTNLDMAIDLRDRVADQL